LINIKGIFEKIRGIINISDEKIKEIIDILHSKKDFKNINKLTTLEILTKIE